MIVSLRPIIPQQYFPKLSLDCCHLLCEHLFPSYLHLLPLHLCHSTVHWVRPMRNSGQIVGLLLPAACWPSPTLGFLSFIYSLSFLPPTLPHTHPNNLFLFKKLLLSLSWQSSSLFLIDVYSVITAADQHIVIPHLQSISPHTL